MAKDKEPGARAEQIRDEIERLKKKRAESAPAPDGTQPRSLRDVIHDRMDKLDKKKDG